jgi:peptide/nickel transport system substrate-binding protein
VVKGGTYVYGNYPDIDALFEQQAAELDVKKREAILHKMQQLVQGAPFTRIFGSWPSSTVPVRASGVGAWLDRRPRLPAPYEDVTLAGK